MRDVRLKRPRVTSGVLGSLAVVLGALLLVLRSVPQEGWLVVGALALSAAVIGGREWLAHKEAAGQMEKERLSALRCRPTLVRDSDPFALGVTPSEIADRFRGAAARPPYVSRDVDAELDRLLRDSAFVAVVGPSKAGKSRTAFEAISRIFPNRLLIAPEMPGFERDGLADAVVAYIESASSGAVIWLDDLQEYLRARAIATQDLNAWRASYPKVVVVATIRDGELASLRGSGLEVERIVDQARMVSLPSLLSGRELEDANAVYPNEDFADGIGVHLVAGQRLVERLVSAREANPSGYAMACAAIDRQRAGITDPATAEELIELAHYYLHDIQPRSRLNEDMAMRGLAWAAEPVIQDIGLLLRHGSDGESYEPFEYAVAYRDGEVGGGGKADLPSATVATLLGRHDGWNLRALGYAAMVRRDVDSGIKAFRKLSADSDPHIAAHGLEDLGRALFEAGQETEGRARTREAAECNFPCVASAAAFRLARRLVDEDEATAERLYRQVLEDPDDWAYPKALVNLGLLLRFKTSVGAVRTDSGVEFPTDDSSHLTERDIALEKEAREMFELALQSDDSEAVANGGQALGVLLESRGEREKAIDAFKAGTAAGGIQARVSLARIYAQDSETLKEAKLLIQDMDEAHLSPNSAVYRHRVAALIASKEETLDIEIERLRRILAQRNSETNDPSLRLRLAVFLLMRASDDDSGEIEALLQAVIHSDSPFKAEAQDLSDLLEPAGPQE